MSSGFTSSITPACSSARMPRAASARLIDRPRSAVDTRGSGRLSYSETVNPRFASNTASSEPAMPAPTILTGCARIEELRRFFQCLSQTLREPEHVFEAVIKRNRRGANHIRLTPVDGDAVLAEPGKYFRP